MSDATSQVIDLNKLSEREMLILVYRKVESLEKTTESQTTKQAQTDIQLAILKTKMQLWSAVIGFVTGLTSSLVVLVLGTFFKK